MADFCRDLKLAPVSIWLVVRILSGYRDVAALLK
jgi:hypothetical protein